MPRNYSRPLPSRRVEHALRGTIYDSYVRRIMWEGVLGTWRDELPGWLACPAAAIPAPAPAPAQGWPQRVLSWWAGRAGEDTDDGVVCPHAWAAPIHKLNCELVWPPALDEPPYGHAHISPPAGGDGHAASVEAELAQFDSWGDYAGGGGGGGPYLELDTPEYWGVISEGWVVERLLAMAGIRLAGILNWLFAEEGGEALWVV